METIIYTDENGLSVVWPSGEVAMEDLIPMVVPEGLVHERVDDSIFPEDFTFRDAWRAHNLGVEGTPTTVEPDLELAREIAHDWRREAREKEFAPHDEVISKQIPGAALTAAEPAREEIRTRYAAIQDELDAAVDVDGLKSIMVSRSLI